jgi:hypothetical protein
MPARKPPIEFSKFRRDIPENRLGTFILRLEYFYHRRGISKLSGDSLENRRDSSKPRLGSFDFRRGIFQVPTGIFEAPPPT